MIGFFMTIMFYLLYWGYRRWADDRSSVLGPTVVLSYPAVAVAFVLATLFVGRLNGLIWGGGETKNSTDARIEQYNSGIPKFLSHPWGYGVGRGAETLNYHLPGGFLTIDTYYLMVLLEYGFVGVIIYYGMMVFGIYYSAKYSILAPRKTREYEMLIPILSALVNFIVIKSVFSQPDNHPLIFMMLGMVAALTYRIRQDVRPGIGSAASAVHAVR